MSASILPPDSALCRALQGAATGRRCVILAGLPGVGKSLLLQQLAILALDAGRTVHSLQWDVARSPFETPELLVRYPETDGVTHPAIRKAVGVWAREAVAAWDSAHPDPRHLLIGEAPLIGNRLIELAQPGDDMAEALLTGPGGLFLVPVPSREVRQQIEAARVRDTSAPAHERERANAIPALMRALWAELADVGWLLGLPEATATAAGATSPPSASPAAAHSSPVFDPDLYGAVYLRLLRHRPAALLPITTALPVQGSVYAGLETVQELAPSPREVAQAMADVAQRPPAAVVQEVENWFRV